ncbi:MAG: ABC transporter ATP-binding protein [Actinomycetota bacterium]
MWRERPIPVLLRAMWDASPRLFGGLALMSVAQGLLPIGFVWVAGQLVGQVPPAVEGGFDSPAGSRLIMLLVLAASLFVVQQILSPFTELVARSMARRVDRLVRTRTLRTMATPAGISHLEDPELQDLILVARGISKGDMTVGLAAMGLAGIFTTLLTGLGASIIVIAWKWWVGLLIIGTWLGVRTYFRRDIMRTVKVMQGNARGLRRTLYYRDIPLQPGVAKELRIFGLRQLFLDRFEDHWFGAMRQVWRDRRRAMWPMFISSAAVLVAHAFGVWVIGRDFTSGNIDLAMLSVLLSASLQSASVGNVNNHDWWLGNGLPALATLSEAERRVANDPAAVPAGGLSVRSDMPMRSIRFEEVGFSYPGNPARIYDGLTLDIPVGSSLAIVGANGAGKTTLVKLLARLYDPTEGRILIDGIDLRELDPVEWQRRLAAIFQDFVQYPLTARENLALGGLSLADDEEALRRAAEQAGALELIESLDGGFDTPLSRQFQGGAELSGGQWQRLALARAMVAVAAGAGVLILDEPTANLDVRAEAALFDRFLDLTKGLTTILVSHRFSTVRRADRICVLDRGRVVELGTHAELVAQGGTYARMFGLQAARFVDLSSVPEGGEAI